MGNQSLLLCFIRNRYYLIKRTLDCVFAVFFLILLLPVIAITAIAVAVSSKGPVLFWSERVGRDGHLFWMPKFRTMTVCSKVMPRECATYTDIKYTVIGKFLRKYSLDEMPQLWSVLKGDMSFIGPRPLLCDDVTSQIRATNPIIYRVRPGISGLAQINGRNFIEPRNKAKYDAFYAGNFCMILDLKIAFNTLWVVFDTSKVK